MHGCQLIRNAAAGTRNPTLLWEMTALNDTNHSTCTEYVEFFPDEKSDGKYSQKSYEDIGKNIDTIYRYRYR